MDTGLIKSEGNVQFEKIEYDVTDKGCQICLFLTCPLHWLPLVPGVIGNKKLTLEGEEVLFEVKGGCCDVNSRLPYGELGSVDDANCCCFKFITSNSSKGMCICPGSGFDHKKTSEIVYELKKRMRERGDTGQIKRVEEALKEIRALRDETAEMREDIKELLKHFNLSPSTLSMTR